ncbi:hypothetical protein HPNQ4228_1342 [Helicobacter pylori NQ4228]|nr:hypothetical protein HPNQ4228_1342 [Helicobacter pylori NQ4228]
MHLGHGGKSCMIIILIVVLVLPCYLKQGYKTLYFDQYQPPKIA